jgi:hypothetical protein
VNIVMIVPGVSQGGYCENCLRDATLLRAFGKMGHEVITVPLYLPFQTDMRQGDFSPIFFGGINVFLQQKSVFFRKTPAWLDRLFDNPRLLNWISGRFRMVDARMLGSTTISMLKGKDGRQAKELDRLVRWLAALKAKPDIVCLSNVLLAGLAGPIREKLQSPLACMLHGEDGFLNTLMPPYNQQAWEILAHQVGRIDVFVAASQDFAGVMGKRFNIGRDKIQIVCGWGVGDNIGKTAEEMISIFKSAAQNFKRIHHA